MYDEIKSIISTVLDEECFDGTGNKDDCLVVVDWDGVYSVEPVDDFELRFPCINENDLMNRVCDELSKFGAKMTQCGTIRIKIDA